MKILDTLSVPCRQFFEYWQSLPKENMTPCKSDFLPEDIPKLLPMIMLLEPFSPIDINVRLIGTKIKDDYPVDLTGKNYLDFIEIDRRKKAGDVMYNVAQQPCGTAVILHYKTKEGLLKTIESIGLPLRYGKNRDQHMLAFMSHALDPRPLKEEYYRANMHLGLLQRYMIDIGHGVCEIET